MFRNILMFISKKIASVFPFGEQKLWINCIFPEFDVFFLWSLSLVKKNEIAFFFFVCVCFFYVLNSLSFMFLIFSFLCFLLLKRQAAGRCLHIFPRDCSRLVVDRNASMSYPFIIQSSTIFYSYRPTLPASWKKPFNVNTTHLHLLFHHSFFKQMLGEVP